VTQLPEEIEIDEMERNSDMFHILDAQGLPYRRKKLSYGDVVFPRFDMGIEIKRITSTYNDLRESFFGGNHLYQQLHDNKRTFQRSALLIQDETRGNIFDEHFTPQHWQSMKDTINAHYNIPMIFTQSTRETIDQIYALYEKLMIKSHEDEYDYAIHHERRPRTLLEKRIYLISGLEGVGKDRTREIMRNIETPYEVIEWIKNDGVLHGKKLKVPGIGKTFFKKNKILLGEKIESS
jgi:ERCC4-type nuclease